MSLLYVLYFSFVSVSFVLGNHIESYQSCIIGSTYHAFKQVEQEQQYNHLTLMIEANDVLSVDKPFQLWGETVYPQRLLLQHLHSTDEVNSSSVNIETGTNVINTYLHQHQWIVELVSNNTTKNVTCSDVFVFDHQQHVVADTIFSIYERAITFVFLGIPQEFDPIDSYYMYPSTNIGRFPVWIRLGYVKIIHRVVWMTELLFEDALRIKDDQDIVQQALDVFSSITFLTPPPEQVEHIVVPISL